VKSAAHVQFNCTEAVLYVTLLPEDDPARLKHVGGSNINNEYNNTHCAFSWRFATFI
jgi:hypothetical protein